MALCSWTRPFWFVQLLTPTMAVMSRHDLSNQKTKTKTKTFFEPPHCLWSLRFWFVEQLTPRFHLQDLVHTPPPSAFRRDLFIKFLVFSLSNWFQEFDNKEDDDNENDKGFIFRILSKLPLHQCSAVTLASSFPQADIREWVMGTSLMGLWGYVDIRERWSENDKVTTHLWSREW